MLTVPEIAAWLGMTQSGVRNVISRKNIQPQGKRGRHNLYSVQDITRHAGSHDRLARSNASGVGH